MSCDMSHIPFIPVKNEARLHRLKYTCNICILSGDARACGLVTSTKETDEDTLRIHSVRNRKDAYR